MSTEICYLHDAVAESCRRCRDEYFEMQNECLPSPIHQRVPQRPSALVAEVPLRVDGAVKRTMVRALANNWEFITAVDDRVGNILLFFRARGRR